jgi:hypothetical protein
MATELSVVGENVSPLRTRFTVRSDGDTERFDVVVVPAGTDVLSGEQAMYLGRLVDAVAHQRKFRRLVEQQVVHGTLRAFMTTGGGQNFPTPGDDIRDCVVWVTTDAGFEHWIPVRELLSDLILTFLSFEDA